MMSGQCPEKPDRMTLFLCYWLPVFLYCLAIFLQSAFPSPESVPHLPGLDKVLHAGAYAVLSVLFYRAYQKTTTGSNMKRAFIFSVLFASGYGISDEIHQYFVPQRNAEVLDAVADFIGSTAGAAFMYGLTGKKAG